MKLAIDYQLKFDEFIHQTDNFKCNFVYAKILMTDWWGDVKDVFDDHLCTKSLNENGEDDEQF